MAIDSFSAPSSILIIGSGVFGLSTAHALARRDAFASTSITVVSRSDPSSPAGFPPSDASSVDSSRIVRADYADPAYAALGAEALVEWRKTGPNDLGGSGRYHESGLVLVADEDGASAPADPSRDISNHRQDVPGRKRKTGMDYVRESWENVLALSAGDPNLAKNLRLLPNREAIRDAVGTGGASGSWGYFNGSSGWADAGASMQWLFDRVQATGRVNFVRGTVDALVHDDVRVQGARLQDGTTLTADLVVLAAGAWTPSLVDLAGQAVATGQVLAYVELTEDEQRQLQHMPTLLNLTTGLFIITPANRVLKVARHAYGYVNPQLANPLHVTPSSPEPVPLPISVPLTASTNTSTNSNQTLSIPAEGATDLRRALREMVPLPSSVRDRPFSRTRLCWYTDTPTGDFLVDWHPHWRGSSGSSGSLFLATGGSGHAFKFLPVLGERVVDRIMGRCPLDLAHRWRWKPTTAAAAAPANIATEDGTRGGRPGLVLQEELAKS